MQYQQVIEIVKESGNFDDKITEKLKYTHNWLANATIAVQK